MSKFGGLARETDKIGRMPIRDSVTGQPIRTIDGREAYIEGYGSDSTTAVKARRTITDGRLRMRNRNKLTSERLETEGNEMLAALTTGWLLVDPTNGSVIEVPHSLANALDLFGAPEMAWLREQWDEFTSDRANF
ncbi:MAG: hypothetical protein KIS96_03470 [Bauldia sp.]|nr:hypothetical protein [Bauldia sp.]